MAWNPDIYNQFKEERYAPFYDLLQLVKIKPGLKVIDLGCGTGELSAKLSALLPESNITGIDYSAEMLAKTRAFEKNQLNFHQSTIEDQLSTGQQWDLVFSNAALQWVDHHKELFARIIKTISQNGQLVVQMPSNHDHFSHRALQSLAQTGAFSTAFKGWYRVSPVLKIEDYAKILFNAGGTEITVYEKIYPHLLKDAGALYNWVSGTAMIPYIEKLPEYLRPSFINEYQKLLNKEFPESPLFYPFKRTLMAATF